MAIQFFKLNESNSLIASNCDFRLDQNYPLIYNIIILSILRVFLRFFFARKFSTGALFGLFQQLQFGCKFSARINSESLLYKTNSQRSLRLEIVKIIEVKIALTQCVVSIRTCFLHPENLSLFSRFPLILSFFSHKLFRLRCECVS